jgi:putative transposase
VDAMLAQISRAACDWRFAVFACCFMPDHLHLLVEAEAEDSDLVNFAHAMKQRTGHEYRRLSTHRLWQKGYFDHVLRDLEGMRVAAKYILANPVRAGLCTEPGDYPFSGSLVWSKEQFVDLWNDTGTV